MRLANRLGAAGLSVANELHTMQLSDEEFRVANERATATKGKRQQLPIGGLLASPVPGSRTQKNPRLFEGRGKGR